MRRFKVVYKVGERLEDKVPPMTAYNFLEAVMIAERAAYQTSTITEKPVIVYSVTEVEG